MSDSIEIQCDEMIATATQIEAAGEQIMQFQSSLESQTSPDVVKKACGDDSYAHKICNGPNGLSAQLQGILDALPNHSGSLDAISGAVRDAVKTMRQSDERSRLSTALRGGVV